MNYISVVSENNSDHLISLGLLERLDAVLSKEQHSEPILDLVAWVLSNMLGEHNYEVKLAVLKSSAFARLLKVCHQSHLDYKVIMALAWLFSNSLKCLAAEKESFEDGTILVNHLGDFFQRHDTSDITFETLWGLFYYLQPEENRVQRINVVVGLNVFNRLLTYLESKKSNIISPLLRIMSVIPEADCHGLPAIRELWVVNVLGDNEGCARVLQANTTGEQRWKRDGLGSALREQYGPQQQGNPSRGHSQRGRNVPRYFRPSAARRAGRASGLPEHPEGLLLRRGYAARGGHAPSEPRRTRS